MMPCGYETDWDRADRYAEYANRVTAMLCKLCQLVDTANAVAVVVPVPSDVAQWWQEHQIMDAARATEAKRRKDAMLRRDAQRESALAKLSPDERAALGVS